ncbi:MAG: restriction endonuclease subunit S [Bacteroidales bacterium]|nr:restriction endonuclease subunit S [Bacteroidales bacterium]
MSENWKKYILLENPEYFNFGNGFWTGKKPPFKTVTVIRNTNFTDSGKIDYSNVAVLEVEKKQFDQRKLIKGDIVIERSGGGPKQPVGRVVYFDKDDGDFSFSNFTSRIRVINEELDPKFVFYYLMNFYEAGNTFEMQAQTTGIRNLDFTKYKNSIRVPLIPNNEQRKIAYILTTIQKAIEQQDKLIKTTTGLKKALMQKLFTEGLHGEPQKETEIGPVPESWEVVEFPKFALLQRGKDLTKSEFKDGNIPVAGSNGVIGYHCESFVKAPGVTIGRSGTCGKPQYYDTDFWAHNTSLYVKAFFENDERFAFYYFEHLNLGRFKTGASVPTLDRNSLNTLMIGVPSKIEQIEIAQILTLTDNKIKIQQKKKQTLSDLFKTLLHELMTGQRRVHEIEFEGMGKEVIKMQQQQTVALAAEKEEKYG